MEKKYIAASRSLSAAPRAKRLREGGGIVVQGGTTSVTIVGGGTSAPSGDGHTHANQAELDKLGVTADGYVTVTDYRSAPGGTGYGLTTERAKAGWADRAGEADRADEAAHAATADHAAVAEALGEEAEQRMRDAFLSRTEDDRAEGHIAFGRGLTAEEEARLEGGATVGDFIAGAKGARVDAAGNAEVESLESRSYLKVFELIYNRLNALEGTTTFADVGTVEQTEVDAEGRQVLSMRRRWAGDVTAFQPGDIVYGYVNRMEGEASGGDGDGTANYRAWAWVEAVDAGANRLTVHRYADTEVPGGRNFDIGPAMVITRWGNVIEPTEATYAGRPELRGTVLVRRTGADGVAAYDNVRQTSFYISSSDGNIVELLGVNKPIVEAYNYGAVVGKLPSGLLDEHTESLLNPNHPYVFARGLIAQDIIRIDYNGTPMRTQRYRGHWSPEVAAAGGEEAYRSTPTMYDTVTHGGDLWQCVADGTGAEPSGASGDWLRMTDASAVADLSVWALRPSATIVSVRADGVVPERVGCVVLLTRPGEAPREIASSFDLLEAGARLYYSLDGAVWREFAMGVSEPLELEEPGAGLLELEQALDGAMEAVLTVGGDEFPASEIGDRIWFELRTAEGDEAEPVVLASVQVPVARDGRDGAAGAEGRPGPALRGPQAWADLPDGYAFQAGGAGEQFLDVVVYEGEYYICRTSHIKMRSLPPGSVMADVRELWRLGDRMDLVATRVLLADYAIIDWLRSRTLLLYDDEGRITGGLSGRDGVQLWVGSEAREAPAPFRVYSDGSMVASRILIAENAIDPREAYQRIVRPGNYTLRPTDADGGALAVGSVELDETQMQDGDTVTLFNPIVESVSYVSQNFAQGMGVEAGVQVGYYNVGTDADPMRWRPEGIGGLYVRGRIYGLPGSFPARLDTGATVYYQETAVDEVFFAGGVVELMKIGDGFYVKSRQCMFLEALVTPRAGINCILVESCGRLCAVFSTNGTWAL